MPMPICTGHSNTASRLRPTTASRMASAARTALGRGLAEEQCQHCIAHVFVDDAAVLRDDLGLAAQVVIEHLDDLFVGQLG